MGNRCARIALLLLAGACPVGCTGTRVRTAGIAPSIRQVSLAPLPSRYETLVIDALEPAGVAVVPRDAAAHELVVYLRSRGGAEADRTPPATNDWYGIDGDNLRGAATWFAVGMWTLFGLLDAPESAQRSVQVDTEAALLVQLVNIRSHRVVWSCSVESRTRGADSNRKELETAMRRLVHAVESP